MDGAQKTKKIFKNKIKDRKMGQQKILNKNKNKVAKLI